MQSMHTPRIARIEAYPVTLPMKRTFATSGGVVGSAAAGAPHVYVRVVDDQGEEGWGEARPSHRWSEETLETVTTTVRRYFAPALQGLPAGDLHAAHEQMNREIASGSTVGQPIAKAAVDMALHDLAARRAGLRLAELWMSTAPARIALSYLISTRDPEQAMKEAAEAKAAGFRGVDVKIGLDLSADLDVLEAVASAARGLFFRVDANQRYTLPQAVQLARRMAALGVDVLEQPLPAHDWFGHAALRRKVDIPVALDESIRTPQDVLLAWKLEACDAVVVKVTKMAGLRGAMRCGEVARDCRLELLGGGLTESTLGFSASAQLFHSLGITTPVDLNGPFFLADDPLEEKVSIEQGEAVLPQGPGHGCTLNLARLRAFSAE